MRPLSTRLSYFFISQYDLFENFSVKSLKQDLSNELISLLVDHLNHDLATTVRAVFLICRLLINVA
jgi:hypothetical protein